MWRVGGSQTRCLRASASASTTSQRVEAARTIRFFHSSKPSSPLMILRDSKRIYGIGNIARNISGLSSFQSENDKDSQQTDNSQRKPPMRKRGLGQHCRTSLSTTPLVSIFPTQPSYRRRLLVTKAEDIDKEKEEAQVASNTQTQTTPTPTGSQPIKSMDPDFASYLSGEKNPLDKRKKPKRERHGRKLLIDNEKELFKNVARMQTTRKEESRLKTVTNVNRALWGNVLICTAKFGAWLSSGSSAMLAEFIHSIVDCGNQSLLLVGLRHSSLVADKKHPYGYGKNIYFWALVSALGTFFLGAGVSMTHAIGDLMNPSLHVIKPEVWGVLGFSFVVDGYVLRKTIQETLSTKPKGMDYFTHLGNIRDPAILAVLLEDGAACLGVLMCFGGIAASHYTGNPIFDGIAGVGISSLLGAMGLALVRMNHRFLLGQAVDRDITDDIEKILLSRRSVDSIGSVQSQWTGPETFSYKAEVDFDGTYLAAKLMPVYQSEFLQIRDSMDEELQVLLALYAEDVIRTVEREVRHVEAYIRKKYPGAEYIELEPMSRDADRLAIDDNLEGELRRVESDALNRYLISLRKEEAAKEKEYNDAQQATTDAQQASRHKAAAAATAADKKYYKDAEAFGDTTTAKKK